MAIQSNKIYLENHSIAISTKTKNSIKIKIAEQLNKADNSKLK